jgi:hypothetical protein
MRSTSYEAPEYANHIIIIIIIIIIDIIKKLNLTSWPESASAIYRPSYLRLPAKLVPIFVDSWWNVVSVTDPYGRILDFSRPKPLLFLPRS